MITKVYLAGASAELDRAKRNAQMLRDADIHVISTWVDVIGKVGAANPADATPEQLTKWTLRDLEEVREADVLWLQLPAAGINTIGAWIELGIAYTSQKMVLMSGIHRPIFTPVLADKHFNSDGEALRWLKRMHDDMIADKVKMRISCQDGIDATLRSRLRHG